MVSDTLTVEIDVKLTDRAQHVLEAASGEDSSAEHEASLLLEKWTSKHANLSNEKRGGEEAALMREFVGDLERLMEKQ